MTVEIRPATSEEMEEVVRIAALTLAEPRETFRHIRPEWTLCAFEDRRLATTFAAYPLTMRFNGNDIPVGAVTCVGTLPIYRRRGHLRRIMTTYFEQLHEQGERSIAILYASWAAIYQRFGYAVVSVHHSYKVEPRYVRFSHPQSVPGTLRETTKGELELLSHIFDRSGKLRTGHLSRHPSRWDHDLLTPHPPKADLSILLYEEDAEQLGYVIYSTEEAFHDGPGPWQRLSIRELVWLTPAAYRAFWDCLGNMDAVREIVWRCVPEDDPLPHLLLEPRMLRTTVWDGILARLVDLPKGLSARPYAGPATLTFHVLDDLCPWNDGRWKLETLGTKTTVSRTDATPQLVMPVSTLAMLVFGQISATEAFRMGRLDAPDQYALPQWDAVMRTQYRPFCPDTF